MQCELCDKNATGKALIEGTELQVCAGCLKYGKALTPLPTYSTSANKAQTGIQARKPKSEDVSGLEQGYGAIIRKAREKRGLTQEQLANILKERSSYLQSIETERHQPNTILLKKIQSFLQISLEEQKEQQEHDKHMNTDALKSRGNQESVLGDVAIIRKRRKK